MEDGYENNSQTLTEGKMLDIKEKNIIKGDRNEIDYHFNGLIVIVCSGCG